jgi:Fe-S protein assembly co-chaperone HscB
MKKDGADVENRSMSKIVPTHSEAIISELDLPEWLKRECHRVAVALTKTAMPDFYYYDLLGVEQKFPLSDSVLSENYYARQQQAHPDLYPHLATQTRQQLTAVSIALTQAYQTLKDPVLHLAYWLSHHGYEVNGHEDNVKPNSSLLEHILNWQELLSEVNTKDHLASLEREITLFFDQSHEEAIGAICQHDLLHAAHQTLAMRYAQKCLHDLKAKRQLWRKNSIASSSKNPESI